MFTKDQKCYQGTIPARDHFCNLLVFDNSAVFLLAKKHSKFWWKSVVGECLLECCINITNRAPVSKTCQQHKRSPTFVTNIVVANLIIYNLFKKNIFRIYLERYINPKIAQNIIWSIIKINIKLSKWCVRDEILIMSIVLLYPRVIFAICLNRLFD